MGSGAILTAGQTSTALKRRLKDRCRIPSFWCARPAARGHHCNHDCHRLRSPPPTARQAALKAKKVEGVVFMPPSGDVAFALIDGKSVRIGKGWPVEVSNSWSSPMWVVRILQNEGVP